MQKIIYAKKRTTRPDENGKTKDFYTYLTKCVRKSNGETFTAEVKFREDCGAPKGSDCPIVIEIPKGKANLTEREYTDATTGETRESKIIWVSEWAPVGAYVDTSMDDIE